MSNESVTYRYRPNGPRAIVVDPPPKVVAANTPTPVACTDTPVIVTGAEARDALRGAVQKVWSSDPALRGVRGELERIGREVEAPAFRGVAEKTGFGREMRAEARRLGLRRLVEGAWGTSE